MRRKFSSIVFSALLLLSLIPVNATAEPVFHVATKITDAKSGVSLELWLGNRYLRDERSTVRSLEHLCKVRSL